MSYGTLRHGWHWYQQHADVTGPARGPDAAASNQCLSTARSDGSFGSTTTASSRRRRAPARGRRGPRRPSTTTCSCRRRRRSSPRTGARAARRRSSGRTSAILWKRPTSRTRAASPRTTPTSSARRRRRSRPFEGRRAAPHSSPFWSCAHAFLICPRPLLPHVFNVLFCVIQACARTDPAIFNSIILHLSLIHI